MKKRFRILAFILTLALAVLPVISVSVSAETVSAENTERGKLTVTELNAAMSGNTSYQFMELYNPTADEVDLQDYYIFRYGYENYISSYVWVFMGNTVNGWSGEHGQRQVQKVRVSTASQKVGGGELALLWFCNDTSKEISDFKTYWNIADSVTVIKVDTTSYPATKMNTTIPQNAGSGFLPIQKAFCVLELVNANIAYNGTNAKDDASTYNSSEALAQARHQAADCLTVFYTDYNHTDTDWKPGTTADVVEDGTVSRHFYSYIDIQKYRTAVTELAPTLKYKDYEPQSFSDAKLEAYGYNFVSGKLDSNGKYAIGNGLKQYLNTAVDGNASSGLFVDDGTHASPTPGALDKGQYGFVIGAPTYFGVQSMLNGDGTYSVRFSGTVDEEVLNCYKLGFDIRVSAKKSDGGIAVKTLDRDCVWIYTAVYGKGENGEELYTQDDITNGDEYFYTVTVTNISIANYENVTFTVTPRVQVDSDSNVLYGQSYTVTYNDGVYVSQRGGQI